MCDSVKIGNHFKIFSFCFLLLQRSYFICAFYCLQSVPNGGDERKVNKITSEWCIHVIH